MEESHISSLDAPRSWELADDHRLFLLGHDIEVVRIKSETGKLLPEGSGNFEPYPSMLGLSTTSSLEKTTASAQEDLMRSLSNSTASSCATFSTTSSWNFSTSLKVDRDWASGVENLEYKSPALSSRNAEEAHKLPVRFQCTHCPERFSRSWNLRDHTRTRHPDEKSFICTVCGEAFARARQYGIHHKEVHSRKENFFCGGDLSQHSQWGCGREFSCLRTLGEHFRSESGQLCMRPLTTRDLDCDKELNQDIHGIEKRASSTSDKESDNFAFHSPLVARYRGLSMLQWSEISHADGAFFADILPSELVSSTRMISSDSSYDAFSSRSSADSKIGRSNDSSRTVLFNPSGSSDTASDVLTPPGTTMPSDSNFETLEGKLSIGENRLADAADIDLSSAKEHMQNIVGDETKESDWTCGSTLKDCHSFGEQIVNSKPMGLDTTHYLYHAHPPFDSAEDMGSSKHLYRVDALGSKNFAEGTTAIQRATNAVPSAHGHRSEHDQYAQILPCRRASPTHGATLGRASPYSIQSQDSDSESGVAGESELSCDDFGSVLSLSPSPSRILDSRRSKQVLIIEIMRAFWEIYNKDFMEINSICITTKGFTSATTSRTHNNSSPRSTSSSSGCSATATSSSISGSSGSKRKLAEDDLPPDDDDQGQKEPAQGSTLMPKDQPIIRFACPFRKYNPRKYNMHHYQTCALGSFSSTARVKEHLYRRHMAPIQCVRCWLFFRDQEHLNIHLSVKNICETRDGEAAEGITPNTERWLRRRRKLPAGQTDSDRWRDIYRNLFLGVADQDIPSPLYESVHDDAAQASASVDVSIEDFMRQEVPQIFTSRLQAQVDAMNLEETGLLDDMSRLRETFILRMASLIKEAQDSAVEAYRQISSECSLQSNHLMTPEPSSSSESTLNSSQEINLTVPDQHENNLHKRQQSVAPPLSRNLQSIRRMPANGALRDFITSQPAQEVEKSDLSSRTNSYPQPTIEDTSHSFMVEQINVEFSSAKQISQQEHGSNGYSLDMTWLADNWNVDPRIFSNSYLP